MTAGRNQAESLTQRVERIGVQEAASKVQPPSKTDIREAAKKVALSRYFAFWSIQNTSRVSQTKLCMIANVVLCVLWLLIHYPSALVSQTNGDIHIHVND